MRRNKVPLRILLAAVIFILAILVGCINYGLSFDLYRKSETYFIMVGLGFLFLILMITMIGFMQGRNWARVSFLFILYLLVINWTVLAYFWAINIMWRRNGIEKFVPIIFSIGIYFILAGAILLINHPKLKEEFERPSGE